jgi:cell pole-organizing protein PopZ
MGDVSAEPSMEDILASIKRIIAEDAENGAPLRARRRPAPPPPVDDFVDDDDVLELSEQAPEPPQAPAPVVAEPEPVQPAAAEPVAAAAPVVAEPIAEPAPMPMSPPVAAAPEPVVAPPVAEKPETIVSPQTAEASRAPLDTLSRLVVKPETAGADTLEGMVREMLRPMLSDWLDRNLPDLVESMVAKEIARITGGR